MPPEHRSVLLRHECGDASHYDWMFEDPGTPFGEGKLVTFRVQHPTWEWRGVAQITLERIADHRRDYLTYEGPLTGDRGNVSRVDTGTIVARRWTDADALLDVRMAHFTGTVRLEKGEEYIYSMTSVSMNQS